MEVIYLNLQSCKEKLVKPLWLNLFSAGFSPLEPLWCVQLSVSALPPFRLRIYAYFAFHKFFEKNLNLRKTMDKPYLPIQFDELKLIKNEDFLRWSSPRIRTVGKIFGNALPRKGLKKKPKLQKEDKIGLIDVQKYKPSQPIAYWKDSLIVLDFDLGPVHLISEVSSNIEIAIEFWMFIYFLLFGWGKFNQN